MKDGKRLEQLLAKQILILDGAMGTGIMERNLEESDYRGQRLKDHPVPLAGNGDVLSLTKPDVIAEIHKEYLLAGANLIETNTFNANAISQGEYGLAGLCREMNLHSAEIACRCAREAEAETGIPRFVVGSMGPTGKSLSYSPSVSDPAFREVTFEQVTWAYQEQAGALLDGGVDALLIETVFDTLVARACLIAIDRAQKERNLDLPVMVSVTLSDQSGRTFSGQTLEAFLYSIRHPRVLSVGINCSLGGEALMPAVRKLAELSPYYLSFHPNAGLPDELGDYTETPGDTAGIMETLGEEGLLNIAGGCCGTGPSHIREIARVLCDTPPRIPKEPLEEMVLCGLEAFHVLPGEGFFPVGEGTNVAGSRAFARLIREGKYQEALRLARKQLLSGAKMLDVSMDDGLLDSKKELPTFLRHLSGDPDLCRFPLMLDSSDFDTLLAALSCIQGKAVVNSLSLKEGEEEFLRKADLLLSFGAAVVVMAFDEQGQAVTYERKIEIAGRAYGLLREKLDYPAEDIILDVNVLALATGMEEHKTVAVDFIRAVEWISKNLKGAKTSGGISNLSFSFRGRDRIRAAMHRVFLEEAAAAGLAMAIINPLLPMEELSGEQELTQLARDLVENLREDAEERMLSYALEAQDGGKGKESGKGEVLPDWRKGDVFHRLKQDLILGVSDYLERDIMEAALQSAPLDILEGPLMEAMGQVGDAFGKGEMFLPQVVKSARVMKGAFEFLRPMMEQGQETETRRPTVVLATVKGDVHDIGKNIVGVVLSCNHFRVVDLGVMVTTEEIIKRAREEKADLVGLSGLITPSLAEMGKVASAMEAAGFGIPLLIGGATTSDLHTALMIAPCYSGGVVRIDDASRCGEVARKLTGPQKEAFLKETKERYEALCLQRQEKGSQERFLAPAEALALRPALTYPKDTTPAFPGIHLLAAGAGSLITGIHWGPFFGAWHLKGTLPGILDDEKQGQEARKIHEDAMKILNALALDDGYAVRACVGIFPAESAEDDILVYPQGEENPGVRLPMMRQLSPAGGHCLSLADFVKPRNPSQDRDHMGLFAVTAGESLDLLRRAGLPTEDPYWQMMARLISHRLAEAMSAWTHQKTETTLWQRTIPIRPAIGFPCLKDHSLKRELFSALEVEKELGITLTDSYMMQPEASVCGFFLAHPMARYFDTGKLSREGFLEYKKRRGLKEEEAEGLLGSLLAE